VTPETDASDAALARLAAAGDDHAFGVLVKRHKQALYRLLRRYTGDRDEAYEAVHETFIAAWSALQRYDESRSFGAWLRTIAINKARDRGRRMVVRRLIFGTRALDDMDAMVAADPSPPADQALIEDQISKKLDAAVGQLPPNLKEALLLTTFEGLSQQEAANILGISVKAVETRAYRARKLLAERLDDDMRPKSR
jgi:RNA polymerase sigma factor (sigma-70 family)